MKLYIARDKNGVLWAFKEKPNKYTQEWCSISGCYLIDHGLFPEVKWEDEEPTEVELVIKENDKEK